MKKLFLILIMVFLVGALQAQNEFRYEIKAKGGISIGVTNANGLVKKVDSLRVNNLTSPTSFRFYSGATELESPSQNYDYVIKKVGSTVYAVPGAGTSYTSYSGSVLSGVLNSALSQLTNGGNIYIKAGTYTDCDSVRISYDNITIEGAGMYKTILKIKDDWDAAKSALGTNGIFYIDEIENFELKNLEIDGNGANQTYIDVEAGETARVVAIKAKQCKNSNFENLYVHDFTKFGLQLRVYDSLTVVKNCVFTRNYWNGIDISWGTYGSIIEGCLIEESGDIGIAIRGAINNIVRDTKIRNITGLNGSSADAWMGINMEYNTSDPRNSRNNLIENVIIEGKGMKRGINMSASGSYYGRNNTVKGCTIDSCEYGIYFYGDSNLIMNNNINGCSEVGIIINTGDNNIISGNNIKMQGADATISIAGDANYNKVLSNYLSIGGTSNWFQSIVLASTADYNVFNGNIIFDALLEISSFNDGATTNVKANNYRANIGTWEPETGSLNTGYTATVGGATTGIIKNGSEFITVTSSNAAYICCLPPASASTIGTVIKGRVGSNGFELRVDAAQATTVYLNGVTTNVEAAIPANSSFEVICIDATHWILKAWTELGAEITAIVPDAV